MSFFASAFSSGVAALATRSVTKCSRMTEVAYIAFPPLKLARCPSLHLITLFIDPPQLFAFSSAFRRISRLRQAVVAGPAPIRSIRAVFGSILVYFGSILSDLTVVFLVRNIVEKRVPFSVRPPSNFRRPNQPHFSREDGCTHGVHVFRHRRSHWFRPAPVR